MPKKAKKAKKAKEPKKPDASYEAFCARWERGKARRLGRGKPGDMDHRPPVIGSPRPHKTSAADFADELLWLATFVGDDVFNQAYIAVMQSGAIKDGKWTKDFRGSSPPGHTSDPFQSCVSFVARMTLAFDSERLALAWAVATFDLPGKTFGCGRREDAQGTASGGEGRYVPGVNVIFGTPQKSK